MLCAALMLGGCAASQAPVPEENYYRLAPETHSPPTQAADAGVSDGLLMVEEFRGDGLHGERAMLYSEVAGHRQLRQYHYDTWADPPTRLVQSYLVQRLRAADAAPQVMRYNINDRGDAFVGGRVERFEHLIQGQRSRVVVDLELRLSYPGEPRPRLLADYRAEATLAGSSPADAITGFEQALNEITARFLSDARQAAANADLR